MTEHLLSDQSFPACLTTAKEIHDCLTVGNMNAYVWWWIISNANGLYNKSGVVQKRGYVLGQFAKFVRNGYYRVDATANPSANIYVKGFKGGGKAVIVAINKWSRIRRDALHHVEFSKYCIEVQRHRQRRRLHVFITGKQRHHICRNGKINRIGLTILLNTLTTGG